MSSALAALDTEAINVQLIVELVQWYAERKWEREYFKSEKGMIYVRKGNKERKGSNFSGFTDFDLQAKARIWP